MSLFTFFALLLVLLTGLPLLALLRWNRNRLGGHASLGSADLGYRVFDGMYVCLLCLLVAVFPIFIVPWAIGIPMSIVVFLVTFMTVLTTRDMKRLLFVDALSVACENSVPIDHVADVFAMTCADPLGHAAANFAVRIRAGQSPIWASQACSLRLPLSIQAILIGQGDPAMRRILRSPATDIDRQFESSASDSMKASITVPLFIMMVPLMFGILTFWSIKILPTLEKMSETFDADLDIGTEAGASLVARFFHHCSFSSYGLSQFTPIIWLFTVILMLLYFIGWWFLRRGSVNEILWRLPLIGPYYRDLHRSDMLDGLSLFIASGQPFDKALASLRYGASRSSVSDRLIKADAILQRGQPWPEALVKSKIVDRATAAWLRSSAETGSLSDALQSAASGLRRRATYRRAAQVSTLLPAVIVLLSIPVLLFGYYMFNALSVFSFAF